METDAILKKKFDSILPYLDEHTARLYLGSEAISIGRGGKQKVSKIAGVSRVRIDKGIAELASKNVNKVVEDQKIRKSGGGRKLAKESQQGLLPALEAIVNPHTRGDPMNPLLWTNKSLRNLETALKEKGYKVSYVTVGELLTSLGYSLQSNRKTDEGSSSLDREAQFEYINEKVLSFMSLNEPVISVDCKKKELIGNYKNAGEEWELKKNAPNVKVYDFIDKELGKAIPYGVYDIAQNQGWVSVGISSDTAEFAVNTIKTWWQQMGKEQYPNAKKLLITADGGGSNSSRSRLWKTELQTFAIEAGIEISVCHFPPGTSKWNKIEHRLFSFITKNWRAKPLISLEVVVNLIANTTTQKGLMIKAKEDKKEYEKGKRLVTKKCSISTSFKVILEVTGTIKLCHKMYYLFFNNAKFQNNKAQVDCKTISLSLVIQANQPCTDLKFALVDFGGNLRIALNNEWFNAKFFDSYGGNYINTTDPSCLGKALNTFKHLYGNDEYNLNKAFQALHMSYEDCNILAYYTANNHF